MSYTLDVFDGQVMVGTDAAEETGAVLIVHVSADGAVDFSTLL